MADSVAAPSARQRLDTCLELLGAAAGRPEQFLSVQDGLAADFVALTKALYDLHHALRGEIVAGSPLEQLVVENFDEEQVWQQLELQNHAVLGSLRKTVARNVEDEGRGLLSLLPDIEEEEEEEEEAGDGAEDMDAEDQGEEDEEDLHRKTSNSEASQNGLPSDEDSELDFDIDKLERQTQKSKKSVRKKTGTYSLVDDRFFKLSEMEAALEAEEKEGSRDDDSDGIDYFEEIFSEDEEEEVEGEEEEEEEEFGVMMKKKATKSARDLKYQDYFDPVDEDSDPLDEKEDDHNSQGGEEDEEEEEEEGSAESTPESTGDMEMRQTRGGKNKDPSKRVTFSLPFESDGEEEPAPSQEKPSKPPEMKSSFEKRQEKMSEKIKSLEQELLKEKPWQLKGEIGGQKRPENSLLEEMLLFDHAVRMAPMVTEETTLELEEMIKRRIKDQAWDDVVRKEKQKDDPFEYKKRLTLDQEKSKLRLAEIYEQEYLKLNQKKTEEKEKPEHVEIQKMMDTLFVKLDALSNFHFMPKPPVPEVKIVSNLPAITMEEVAPVHVSDAALLAPEEVKEKNKGGDVKTDAEKTPTDKKRDRRRKKKVKRLKMKEKERRQKLLESQSHPSAKLNKKATEVQLKKLAKERGTSLLKDDGGDKALKSSKAFFSQLQDQVKMQIKETKKTQKRPKKQGLSAQKLKL